MKKLFVNGKLIAMGNYEIKEVDEPQKYTIKIYYDSDCELDSCNYWNEKTLFYSNHRDYRFDGKVDDDLIQNLKRKEVDGKKYYPVYMYDHSGIAISKTPFNDRWDSGMLGIAEIDNSSGDADDLFECFYEELKACMEGQVFKYKVFDEVGEVMDSCSRFYGEDVIEAIYECIPEQYGITIQDVADAFDAGIEN